MIFIFPLIGIFFAAIKLFVNNLYGIGFLPGMIIYTAEYTLIAAFCFVAFLVMLSLFIDPKKPNEKFGKFYNAVISFTLKIALSACNVKVVVKGEEKIPKGRFVPRFPLSRSRNRENREVLWKVPPRGKILQARQRKLPGCFR